MINKNKKIVVGNNKGGCALKNNIIKYAKKLGFEIIDVTPNVYDDDETYINRGHLVAQYAKDHNIDIAMGFCGSGQGITLGMNSVDGFKSIAITTLEEAKEVIKKNNYNSLNVGGRLVSKEESEKIFVEFMKSKKIL